MSSSPFFSSVAVSRPFFPEHSVAPRKVSAKAFLTASLPEVVPASRLEVRPTPELVSCGIRELDELTGGFPRGCLTEVCGPASSGRTSLLIAALAAATRRQEACALVDVSDAFDPASAKSAGVDFAKLLWVRCGTQEKWGRKREGHDWEGHDFSRAAYSSLKSGALAPEDKNKNCETPVDQALRVTDLLLQSGGFGLVIVDLGDVFFKIARRISLTSWFRYQRAVEHTSTVLLTITPAPCAQTCAALLLQMQSQKKPSAFSYQLSVESNDTVEGHGFSHAEPGSAISRALVPEIPSHAELLGKFDIQIEILRSRMPRKPARSTTAAFTTKAVRAG